MQPDLATPDLATAAPPATTRPAAASPFGDPCRLILADGVFMDAADARVSAPASALSYGTGAFDGTRASWIPGHEHSTPSPPSPAAPAHSTAEWTTTVYPRSTHP